MSAKTGEQIHKIGYVFPHAADGPDPGLNLEAAGCDEIRVEEFSLEHSVLATILGSISKGDELLVPSLRHLGSSAQAILHALDKLDARGARLRILEPALTSDGLSGQGLRAALEAVLVMERAGPRRRLRGLHASREIQALHWQGVRTVDIARRLGISRMTVWRKLKAGRAYPE